MRVGGIIFVANLRPQSIASYETVGSKPGAWLLSTHRITNQTFQYVQIMRDQSRLMLLILSS